MNVLRTVALKLRNLSSAPFSYDRAVFLLSDALATRTNTLSESLHFIRNHERNALFRKPNPLPVKLRRPYLSRKSPPTLSIVRQCSPPHAQKTGLPAVNPLWIRHIPLRINGSSLNYGLIDNGGRGPFRRKGTRRTCCRDGGQLVRIWRL